MGMRRAIGTACIMASVAAGSLLAQPAGRVTRTTGGDADPTGQGVYQPSADPSIMFGESAAEHVSRSLFGWWDPTVRWNLSIDGPPDEHGAAAGRNDFGQAFDFEAAMWSERPIDLDGYERGTCYRGIWSGSLSSSAGALVVRGVSFRTPEGTTLVPLIVPRDQDAAWETFGLFRGIAEATGPRCVLDDVARFQLEQARIAAQHCVNTQGQYYANGIVACSLVGVGLCLWTFGAGCIAMIACDVALLTSWCAWEVAYRNEWRRMAECMCLESRWREENPGRPLPAASCAGFNCPPFVVLPFRL